MKKTWNVLSALLVFFYCIVLLNGCSDGGVHLSVSSEQASFKEELPESIPSDQLEQDQIRVRVFLEKGELVLSLDDNPTTQSLIGQLPATVKFSDFAGAEKIAYLPEKLSTENAPAGADHEKGDVACYGPWGNLVFYYNSGDYATGVIPMGKIESGIDLLEKMDSDFEAVLEIVNS